ncbi:MAG: hypothetical protein JST40_03330 [Armatimonadetes bacterium]|nr:hypothetical protein [Armatimonadota bacterium]
MKPTIILRAAVWATALMTTTLGWTQSKTWSTSQDFNEGIYFNTNSTAVPGELRLNRFGTAPVPFINIPVGGRTLADRGWPYSVGRIVRVNTETGLVVGEYRCTPAGLESSPSRAVVDSLGNVWATNAYEGQGTRAVTKIGVIIGGTRYYQPIPGVFIQHPLGEYVKDPTYTTGVDRNGDGYIRTSAGLGNLLAWDGTTGKDLDSSVPEAAPGTVQEADDELITVFKRYRGSGGKSRSIALDENNKVWVGFHDNVVGVMQLDDVDGHVIKTLEGPIPGYTMLYQNGQLWATAIDTVDNRPYRIDSTTGAATMVTGDRNYAIAAFAPLSNGDIVASCGSGSGHPVPELLIIDKTTAAIKKYISVPGGGDLRGIIQDQDGDIWVASRGLWAGGPYRVYRYRQDGTPVRDFYTGDRPCGLGLDSNGNVWVTHIGDPGNQANGNWTTVIDPRADSNNGAIIGSVGVGTGSYNYSDGTGATTSQISRDGEWRVTHDSFRPNLRWGAFSWQAVTPANTSVEVFARAANTRLGLLGKVFVKVSNGVVPTEDISGRYVEIRVRLARGEGTSSDVTPSVQSLTARYYPGTVSGNVGLSQWLPEQYPSADFRLTPTSGGNSIEVPNVELGPFGAFAFVTQARGQFECSAKSSHWLRQMLTVPITITDNGSGGNVFALLNGDVDEDNGITVFDYFVLSEAFGSFSGDTNFVENADLDGDDEITIFDYLVLSENFDRFGDE